jgi:transcriptional regulator GlxA family with amidase domain
MKGKAPGNQFVHGADDYLPKPFDARELLIRVHNLIVLRKGLHENFRKEVSITPLHLNFRPADMSFMKRVMDSMEKNYSDPVYGPDQLTQHLSMTRIQFHRKLKALTNKTPGDFIRLYRLEKAKNILLNSSLSIMEVAQKTGFTNVSTFIKQFRNFAGADPSEFVSRRSEVQIAKED